MTPFASVAMLEKLALLKIALCNAPVFSRASVCMTSGTSRTFTATAAASGVVSWTVSMCPPFPESLGNRRRRFGDQLRGICPWEIQLERRARADFAVDVDGPAAPRDDAVDGRQAEPRALSDLLGGEERLEQARLHLRRHAGSRIGHGQHHVGARFLRGGCFCVLLVAGDI